MKRKVVFVTGSSKGIGKGIATEFAKKGYIVVLNCKNSVAIPLPIPLDEPVCVPIP